MFRLQITDTSKNKYVILFSWVLMQKHQFNLTYCIKCDQIRSTCVACAHLRNLTFQSMQTGNSSYRCVQHIPLANVSIFQLTDQPLSLMLFVDIIKRYLANLNNIRFSQIIRSKHILI
jgi:hypothetical protein